MKIKTGDKVKMLSGKDKGKTGKVLQVLSLERKVVVEGLNLLVKHQRPKRQNEKGQRIQFPAAVGESKVMLICPKCGRETRVGYQFMADAAKKNKKTKNRRCHKCHEVI